MAAPRLTPRSLHTTTKRSPLAFEGGRLVVPALTIVHHPDLRRVGDVAILKSLGSGGLVALSRLEPAFAPLGGEAGVPLGDTFLSRKPLSIEGASRDGLRLTAAPGLQAAVDGVALDGAAEIDGERLARGVVLELADRAVLLLHRIALPVERGEKLGLVGDSDALEAVRVSIRQIADLDVSVLIRGATGTGKELVARAIAALGPRKDGPFVPINMAAIPPAIAAAELFGHARGAFTSAVDERDGHFADAHGGTLFMDEVGLTPVEVQPLLLRALETREIQALGSRRRRKVDVRFLAATDTDLEAAVAAGKISEALVNRLCGYQIAVPALRDRREDIGRLVVCFLREELAAVGEEHRLQAPAAERPWLPAGLMARLARAPWPGNVRQLRNVVRQIVISSRGQAQARLEPHVAQVLDAPGAPAAPVARTEPLDPEKQEILEALERSAGNQTRAAAALGISRRTFCKRLKLHGIPRPRV